MAEKLGGKEKFALVNLKALNPGQPLFLARLKISNVNYIIIWSYLDVKLEVKFSYRLRKLNCEF